ncbi:MAG: hypothetical protein ACOX5J_01485 [Candidatus Hydrogenedentales bacterium]|jgi:hypothetical protein
MNADQNDVRKYWRSAFLTSILASIFWFVDKRVASEYWRLNVVLFTAIPVYYWVKWIMMSIELRLADLARQIADSRRSEVE